jgi:group I intron endonuclease
MAATIYRITNNLTNDFYIGKTVQNLNIRFNSHKSTAKAGNPCHLHRALRKYGPEAFSIALVEKVDNMVLLNSREIYWIATLSPHYNMTPGGEGGPAGRKRSPETCAKISKSCRGLKRSPEFCAKMSSVKRGVKRRAFTTEHRNNLSKAKIGNKNHIKKWR